MGYIGNTPAEKYQTLDKQTFSVSATTGYTLSSAVTNPQDIALFINNVRQNPNSSYSVSGTALTLSAATASGDTMYCVFLGKSVGTVGVPVNGVGTSQIIDDAVTSAKVNLTDELHINSAASGNTLHTLLKLETDGTADGSGITIDTRTAHTRGEINFLDGTGSYDSNYVFKTATGSQLATPTEKFRVSPTGATVTGDMTVTDEMFIGTTAAIEDRKLSILYSRQSQAGILIKNGDSANAAVHMTFQNTNGTVGTITVDGTSTAYATSSDYRLKENVDYTFDATTRLKQLKPARFNFIADADKTVDGFIAHEVSSVVPEAVTGEKDATEMQGIDQSKLVPLLVKTIQELEARITELENA